jgi:hypothetical protein
MMSVEDPKCYTIHLQCSKYEVSIDAVNSGIIPGFNVWCCYGHTMKGARWNTWQMYEIKIISLRNIYIT